MTEEQERNHRDMILNYGFKEHKEVTRVIDRNTRYEVLKRQRWKCNMCGTTLRFSKNSQWDGEIAHIDHIHPFSERFTYPKGAESINETENLQALCKDCNLHKSNKRIH